MHTRRQLLKATGISLAALSSARHTRSLAQSSESDPLWQQVRLQFSFSESAVPMNAANLCPSFRSVSEAVNSLTIDIDRDCSFNNRAKFGDLLEEARTLVANQLNVTADEVALVRNTSEANNIINNGLQLDPGSEVLLWDQNHPTNNVAWDVRAARFGLTVRKIATPAQPRNSEELVDTFVSRFGANTKVLAITHVSNVSGIRLPVKEITEAAHQRGIYVHLDGAQTWGAMALDLKALGVDSFSASAHKWYMGPREVGLLYIKSSQIENVWPNTIAPGWGSGVETTLRGARKFESLGQRDDAALAGLGVAARHHDSLGMELIQNRIVQLSQRLKEGIADSGLSLVTPVDAGLSLGVCITRAPDGQAGQLANRLYSEYGIAGAPTGGIRLCPTIYNTEEHIDRAVSALKTMLG